MKKLVEAVRLSDRMKKCQTSMKFLYGDEYNKKISFYRGALQGIMQKEKIDIAKAIIFACNLEGVKDNGMAVMGFMAAGVEIMEGN